MCPSSRPGTLPPALGRSNNISRIGGEGFSDQFRGEATFRQMPVFRRTDIERTLGARLFAQLGQTSRFKRRERVRGLGIGVFTLSLCEETPVCVLGRLQMGPQKEII